MNIVLIQATRAWKEISMDFIEGLLKSKGKDTILVVIYRLTKLAHFLLLTHPFSATTVANLIHGSYRQVAWYS